MNRSQRRKLDRKLRSVDGYSLYKKLVEETMNRAADEDMLKDGERVRINVEQITGRREFLHLNPKYQKFIADNVDTVFTARVRKYGRGGYPAIIDLQEDDTWSFWIGDLIRVDKE